MDEQLVKMEKQLTRLTEDLKNLKTERTNKRLTAIGAIATPIVVAVLGGYFALTKTDTERLGNQDNIMATTEIAEKDRWLEQARFARELMDDFLNSEESRAKMALELAAHADPNLGSRLAEIVANSSESKVIVTQFATEKRSQLMERLLRELIHPEKSIRWNAAEGLLSYNKDKELISKLIKFAYEDSQASQKTGGDNWRIYNVAAVLLDLAKGGNEIIFENEENIKRFIKWAKEKDPRSENLVNQLSEILKR